MNKKYIVGIVLGILFIALITLVAKNRNSIPTTSLDKIQVSASFYPLYFFASEVGGEKVNVINITPEGTEPHEYEPTPKDLVTIQNSKMLILNGAGLEPWSENALKNIDTQNTVVVVTSDNIATLEGEEHGHEEEGEEHEDEADHEEEEGHETDPHVWLSPVLASQMVDKIEQGFTKADPDNSSYYASNAEKLKDRLSDLDQEYKQGLAQCASRDIITSHAAFGYLALAYNLKQIPIAGISTESEPSTKELAEVADYAKKNNIKYIFFESLVSPKLSQTIATEVGAKTLVLNPIEGLAQDEINSKKDYFSEMKNNLANLKIALQCQ